MRAGAPGRSSLRFPWLLDGCQARARPAAVPWITKGEREQPERGLLVRRQVGDLLDGVLDVAERLASPDQLCDHVAVAGKSRPEMSPAHGPPFLVPSPP